MPLPVAHGLIGASVVAALLPLSRSRIAKPLLLGAVLGISPDLDYALNWFRISGGGWHHGFTHSIPFALVVGLFTIVLAREFKVRSFLVFSAAYVSHTLLDYLITESQGVALWWPFTDHRYKLRLPNPIDYSSLWESALEMIKIVLTELMLFAPMLLVIVLLRAILRRRARMKQTLGASVSVLVITFLAATPAFAQDKQRIIRWNDPIPAGIIKSSQYIVVPRIEVLEIVDVAVGGKSITFGESFTADDEWVKNLTVRVRNISQRSISVVQFNLFLTDLMPGGPMVTLCHGCGDVAKGQSIAPGDEAELKIVFYDWLLGQIKAKSPLSLVTNAEIKDMLVTLHDGKILYSQCVKAANQNNACAPKP